MISLKSLDNPNLTLRRTLTIQKSFDLVSGHQVVGKLHYKDGKTTAVAEITEGSWIFRNTSLSDPHISLWTNSREFVAMFEVNRIGSGNLLVQDGRRLKWEKSKKLPEEWYFSNIIGERLLKFLPEYGDYRNQGRTILYPESFNISNLGLFVLLGWFTLAVLDTRKSTRQITERYTPW
jgi:hypothetical protein